MSPSRNMGWDPWLIISQAGLYFTQFHVLSFDADSFNAIRPLFDPLPAHTTTFDDLC
jgi:hypothetical protein